MTAHNNEIENSRTGGFGGSDARLFYKVGRKGLSALSDTDKKRIAVARGLSVYNSVKKTDAMRKGHEFEEWFASQDFAPIATREVKISAPLARNFDVFAHVDMYATDGVNSEGWELKCTKKPDIAAESYMSQLQWYHMLGVRNVWLVVCDSEKTFELGTRFPVRIERDQQHIDTMLHGIKLIDEAWESFGTAEQDEVNETDLLPFDRKDVAIMTKCLMQIKTLEKTAEELKERIKMLMENSGIKSIKSESYSIVYQPESEVVTFDKEKLFSEHTEIREEDFQKVSKKKSFVKITLK